MPDNQEILDLRRRARRRLIGAIALVLALVIIPPWVMDLEPRPVVTNLTVDIPKQDPGAARPPVAPTAPTAAAPADPSIPRPPDVSPETGAPSERPKPTPAQSAALARAAAAEAARKEAEAKRAQAILNADGFVVPIGAFANPENVKNLESKLAKAGVKYYTEKISTPAGEQTRVRAGPFATKDSAEKTRERLQTLGMSPGAVIAQR